MEISRESNTVDSALLQDFPCADLNRRAHQTRSACGERKATHALYKPSTGVCGAPCALRNCVGETMWA